MDGGDESRANGNDPRRPVDGRRGRQDFARRSRGGSRIAGHLGRGGFTPGFGGLVRSLLNQISVPNDHYHIPIPHGNEFTLMMQHMMQSMPMQGGDVASGPPPASKAAIESLLDMTIAEITVINHCAVCRDSLNTGQSAKELPCKHVFHSVCIVPWLEIRNTCPVCRYELPTDDEAYDDYREAVRRREAAPAPVSAAAEPSVFGDDEEDEYDSGHEYYTDDDPPPLEDDEVVDDDDDDDIPPLEDEDEDEAEQSTPAPESNDVEMTENDMDVPGLVSDSGGEEESASVPPPGTLNMPALVASSSDEESPDDDYNDDDDADDHSHASQGQYCNHCNSVHPASPADRVADLNERIIELNAQNEQLTRHLEMERRSDAGRARVRAEQLAGESRALAAMSIENLRELERQQLVGIRRTREAIDSRLENSPAPSCKACSSRPIDCVLRPCLCAAVCKICAASCVSECPSCRKPFNGFNPITFV